MFNRMCENTTWKRLWTCALIDIDQRVFAAIMILAISVILAGSLAMFSRHKLIKALSERVISQLISLSQFSRNFGSE